MDNARGTVFYPPLIAQSGSGNFAKGENRSDHEGRQRCWKIRMIISLVRRFHLVMSTFYSGTAETRLNDRENKERLMSLQGEAVSRGGGAGEEEGREGLVDFERKIIF